MEPDICTSLICPGPPNKHCPECSHAIFNGEGIDEKGKIWRWEFAPMFGPLFLRKDGEPMKQQPVRENHPAWKPFEEWYNARRKSMAGEAI